MNDLSTITDFCVVVVSWDDLPPVIKAVTTRRIPEDLQSYERDLVYIKTRDTLAWDLIVTIAEQGIQRLFVHEMRWQARELTVAVAMIPPIEAEVTA